jgi:hypothetical protein
MGIAVLGGGIVTLLGCMLRYATAEVWPDVLVTLGSLLVLVLVGVTTIDTASVFGGFAASHGLSVSQGTLTWGILLLAVGASIGAVTYTGDLLVSRSRGTPWRRAMDLS